MIALRLLPVLLLLAGCEQGEIAQVESLRPPRASFAAPTHDFGRVEQGAVVRHAFRLRNEGDVDLNVVGTRAACDCAVDVKARTVAPGDSATIDVTFDTAAVHGPQERTVTVYTNDPQQRTLLLAMQGEVGLDVAVVPRQIYVGNLPRGAPIEPEVEIRSHDGGGRVTAVESAGGFLRAEPLEDGRLALAIASGAPLGDFADDVLVYTTNHRRPLLRLHVRGTVAADVVASPSRLDFGTVGEAAPVRRALIENLRPEQPVRVTGVEMDERFGHAEVETIEDGLRYRVAARLNDLPAGDHESVVVVRTDHPEIARLELPLHAVVAPPTPGADGRRAVAPE